VLRWRRNGLESVGKGASDGGSVGVDRSDCVLYPTYTQSPAGIDLQKKQIIHGIASA
jgi:hypothetical protein